MFAVVSTLPSSLDASVASRISRWPSRHSLHPATVSRHPHCNCHPVVPWRSGSLIAVGIGHRRVTVLPGGVRGTRDGRSAVIGIVRCI